MLELNKLYNMDCMQGMKEFPDGFFDLAIVDPPYGIGIFDRGLLNRNGVMDVWNMAHVEGGEKYYIRKEYAEVSELGKEVTPNAKKDGSGVPNNDPAAIDPDGGGEAN